MSGWHGVLAAGLLLGCAGALAHDPDKPNRHVDRYEHYEGTQTCLECHEAEALTFFDSRHYQWRGGAPKVVSGDSLETLGKLTTINDFCTTPGYQWIGEVLNDEGKVLAKGCSACHAGLGEMPGSEPTRAQLENWRGMGQAELPLVWNHRSGRKSLILDNTAHYVVGMDPMESQVLLHGLRDWATQPQFVYSHEWSLGDAVVWDNTGTMHRAMPYDPDCGRLLHRTKTAGEEPFG